MITSELEGLIQTVSQDILALPNPDYKPNSSKWSKKEILGHLCDSATMNHKRFIDRLYSHEDIKLELYKQNHWVEFNDYQNCYTIDEVLTLWIALNQRIVKTMKTIATEKLALQFNVSENEKVTLEWLYSDYVEHLKHHLKQIFDQK
ncbi:DinB family protein [Bacillus sp. JJ664]